MASSNICPDAAQRISDGFLVNLFLLFSRVIIIIINVELFYSPFNYIM